MPTIKRVASKSLRLPCGDGADEFVVQYTNKGDPLREGISIGLRNDDFDKDVTVMLNDPEALQLRDLLNRLYPS